jgi:hypothetical protein
MPRRCPTYIQMYLDVAPPNCHWYYAFAALAAASSTRRVSCETYPSPDVYITVLTENPLN